MRGTWISLRSLDRGRDRGWPLLGTDARGSRPRGGEHELHPSAGGPDSSACGAGPPRLPGWSCPIESVGENAAVPTVRPRLACLEEN
jgi:hypothetical protein